MIQATIEELNRLANTGNLSNRDMALVMEENQRYGEYLEFVENQIIENGVDASITLQVDGTTIRFETIDNMASWLTENIT